MAGDGNEGGSSDFVPIDPPYQQMGQIEERSESRTEGLSAFRHAVALYMDPSDNDDDEPFVRPRPLLPPARPNLFLFHAGRVASPAVAVKKLETKRYGGPEEGTSADGSTGCVICIQDYEVGDEISVVPCSGRHKFHQRCLDVWLTRKRLCPLCRHALPAELQRGIN